MNPFTLLLTLTACLYGTIILHQHLKTRGWDAYAYAVGLMCTLALGIQVTAVALHLQAGWVAPLVGGLTGAAYLRLLTTWARLRA
ncbi:hypothetical protein [Deinococcus kurensis]|uniref:hypothetical protein n=1 Tax=Deinococcus kurensis TaxID=2662757 RepID=UPI0012D34C2F|nr:hypothetical protein [Deinococcus kurensis]